MATPVDLFRNGVACLLCLNAWALPAQAQETPPPAYQLAAHEAGIPSAVLFAVALQESGAHLRGRRVPWPWTLNIAGTPYHFATRVEACAILRRALEQLPPTRIDAGLGQVNVGYQAHRFGEPCELLDPYRNLAIAATILREHHDPGEDWLLAIGRYYRPAGGGLAERYQHSVSRQLTRLIGKNVSTIQLEPPLP
jgi:hypothetical protein